MRPKNNLLVCDFFCGSGVLSDEFNSILTHDYPYLQRRRLLSDYHHGYPYEGPFRCRFESWPCHNAQLFETFLSQLEQERHQKPIASRIGGKSSGVEDYTLLNSDIDGRAITCATKNTMNLFKQKKLGNEEDVVIPDVVILITLQL